VWDDTDGMKLERPAHIPLSVRTAAEPVASRGGFTESERCILLVFKWSFIFYFFKPLVRILLYNGQKIKLKRTGLVWSWEGPAAELQWKPDGRDLSPRWGSEEPLGSERMSPVSSRQINPEEHAMLHLLVVSLIRYLSRAAVSRSNVTSLAIMLCVRIYGNERTINIGSIYPII